MASEVDICNLALGHIGDSATVSSLSPPEGSAQAEHCARFYPMARDSILEQHPWGFATFRTNLALLSDAWPEWQYCYAVPTDALNILAVLPPLASNDYSVSYSTSGSMAYGDMSGMPTVSGGNYQPQPYSVESLDDGTDVIYTDQESAALRYSARVTDTTKFSPLFTDALSWLLASYLAGPVIKGDAGAAESKRCLQMFTAVMGKATISDANQRRNTISISTPWMSGR